MVNQPQKKNVSIQQVLTSLLDEQNVFPPAYLRRFSDLEGADLEAVRSVWPQATPYRRFTLIEDLEELAEVDTLVSFDNLARMALQDADPRVRTVAIRLLWESEDPRLADTFLKMLKEDENVDVRAAAATGLGKFVYLGELEEIPGAIFRRVEDELLQVITGKDNPLIRRQALESMGYSGRKEIVPLIKEAYNNSAEPDWVASALFAMGRSVDPAWGPDVIRMLQSPKANIQLEAVRAAGSLELERSRRILLDLLEEEAQDSELRAAVIWSLSQVGGDEVREVLEKLLEESEDEDEIEILENALDNLSFTEDEGLFGLFDFQQLGQPNEEIEDIESYVTRLEGEEDLPALDGADGSPADTSSGDEEPPSDHNPKTGSSKKPYRRH